MTSLYMPPSLASGSISDTLANRPAAGVPGRFFLGSDNGQLYRDDGTAWKAVGGGVELGYAEITTDFSTASTTFVDVTGLSTTVTVADRPVKVIVDFMVWTLAAASDSYRLVEDSTNLDLGIATMPATSFFQIHRERRRTPSAGSHTYKLQMKVSTSTGHVDGSATNTGGPAFIQVVQQ